MTRLWRCRPSGSMLVALLALVLAMTGSAVAASLITSKQIKDGTIQVKDLSKATINALKGKQGTAGPQGPAGAQGPQGAKGDTGAAGAPAPPNLWVVVNSDGTIKRQSGAVTSVTSPGTGDYIVTFNRPVNTCGYAATVSKVVPSNQIVVAGFDDGATGNVTSTSQIEVNVGDSSGANVNNRFHLVVSC